MCVTKGIRLFCLTHTEKHIICEVTTKPFKNTKVGCFYVCAREREGKNRRALWCVLMESEKSLVMGSQTEKKRDYKESYCSFFLFLSLFFLLSLLYWLFFFLSLSFSHSPEPLSRFALNQKIFLSVACVEQQTPLLSIKPM